MPLVTAEDFFSVSHRTVFGLMIDMYSHGEAIDSITLEDKLRGIDQLEKCGGIGFINELIDSGTSSHELETYAKAVADFASVRRTREAALDILNSDFGRFDNAAEYLNYADGRMQSAIDKRKASNTIHIREVMRQNMDVLMNNYDRAKTGNLNKLKTGFYDLDEKVIIDDTDMVILAARPSMGKTALATNIIVNTCATEKDAALFFSLEMSKESLAMRVMAGHSRLNLKTLRICDMNDDRFFRLGKTVQHYKNVNLYINDTSAIRPSEIRAASKRLQSQLQKQGKMLRMIGVDYLQLCKGSNNRNQNRDREVGEMSAALKNLSKEIKVPILVLSQLSRYVERREDKRPILSDLRDTGNLEQDGDVILMLYRDDYYNEDSPDEGLVEVLIRKQRNGETDIVKLKFFPEQTRFENHIKDDGGYYEQN